MKRLALAALAMLVALGPTLAPVAEAKALRGDVFITAMDGNTLTGKMADGTVYKLFFLPGGQATIQEGKKQPQSGTWSLDKSGDVCLKWPSSVTSENGCYRVDVEGHKVSWSNKDGTEKARLFGGSPRSI